MILGLLGGCVAIMLAATIAAATTVFEVVGVVSDAFSRGVLVQSKALTKAKAGSPVTILVLGSDSRVESRVAIDAADPPHSDSIMLVRLDPGRGQTTVMSVPRDLEVTFSIDGREYIDYKINSAFTFGGPTESLEVIRNLLDIPINDVIVMNFQTFADVVDQLGCVYIDVDHLFYTPPDSGSMAIDIEPGYQPLCGYKALEYTRFRETDSTYARDAREQDFLRQAKQQLGILSLLTNPGKLQKVIDAVGKGLGTNIRGSNAVLRLVEDAEAAANGPVRQVPFPENEAVVGPEGSEQTATPSEIQAVVKSFLSGTGTVKLPHSRRARRRHHRGATLAPPAGLMQTPTYVTQQALVMSVQVPFRVELPALTSIDGSQADASDFYAYKIRVPQPAAYAGQSYSGYRVTWADDSADGAYYGIEGINWTDPPLFRAAPSTKIDGRRYMFVLDGSSYHDIGWIRGKDLYWVSNTIFDNLTNAQMLAIAESASPLA
jgi:LCP family protein required for cell wall assembly